MSNKREPLLYCALKLQRETPVTTRYGFVIAYTMSPTNRLNDSFSTTQRVKDEPVLQIRHLAMGRLLPIM